jgi:hypothetical protein
MNPAYYYTLVFPITSPFYNFNSRYSGIEFLQNVNAAKANSHRIYLSHAWYKRPSVSRLTLSILEEYLQENEKKLKAAQTDEERWVYANIREYVSYDLQNLKDKARIYWFSLWAFAPSPPPSSKQTA